MRSAALVISRILSLLLAFMLGFFSFAGVLVGAGYYIYSKVTIDGLNEMGAGIDTSTVIDSDSADVSLTGMTIAEMISEFGSLAQLGEDLTLNYVVDRYGLILPEEVDTLLPTEAKDMALSTLFSKDGVMEILGGVYIGNILGYEREDDCWLDGGTEVEGINAILADYSIQTLISEGINMDSLMDSLTVGLVLGLEAKSELPVYINNSGSLTEASDFDKEITVWLDNSGACASSLVGVLASFKVSEISNKLTTLSIGDLTGLVKYGEDWYSYSYVSDSLGERVELSLAEDITTELAHVTMEQVSAGELEGEIKNITIGSFMGYDYNEESGEWIDKNNMPVTGIMGVISSFNVNELDTELGSLKIGEVAGYIPVQTTDGSQVITTWYAVYDEENPENNVKASGIIATLSDLSVDQITDNDKLTTKIKTLTVGEALGFDTRADGIYDSAAPDAERVSGIMATISDARLDSLEDDISQSQMGELLGYTKDESSAVPVLDGQGNIVSYTYTWYDGEISPENKTHVLMNKVANTTFEGVGTLADDLTVADVIPTDHRTGMLEFVDTDTRITEIDVEMARIFNEVVLGDFVENGTLNFETEAKKERFLSTPFADMTLPEILDYLVGLDDAIHPTVE